jgi:hypothetical protein
VWADGNHVALGRCAADEFTTAGQRCESRTAHGLNPSAARQTVEQGSATAGTVAPRGTAWLGPDSVCPDTRPLSLLLGKILPNS